MKSAMPESESRNGTIVRGQTERIEGQEMEEGNQDEDKKLARLAEDIINGIYGEPNCKPSDFESWSVKDQCAWMEKKFEPIVTLSKSLVNIAVAIMRPGDCGRPDTDRPDWLDMDKFRRGQKFARDHFFSVSYAEVLGLMQVFTFRQGVEPLIFTGNSTTPYSSFLRYLSTERRIRNWYTEDPWTKGTTAHKDIQVVRSMHLALRRKYFQYDNATVKEMSCIKNARAPLFENLTKDFKNTCPSSAAGQCPYLLFDNQPFRPKGMNQGDMAATQFAFISLIIYAPKQLGIHDATDEDLDAFCHVWRGIGYLLGMEDEFNFCRGTFKQIKERTNDFIESWVKPNFRTIQPDWEQIMRSLLEGITYYFNGINFEIALLHLGKIFNFDLPHVYASMDYVSWMKWMMLGPFLEYTCRVPVVVQVLNATLNYRIDKATEYTPEMLRRLEEKSKKTMESWSIPINVS